MNPNEPNNSEDIAISISGVSKTFKLPHEKQTSIKGALINLHKRRQFERQQALKDISFEVKKGDFFGIVGRNGSGKSTLLKLIAGIYSPDEGGITVNGKLTPFIELGVGFNPELTGRENIFLNGALLGFSRKEMSGMYEDIVKFAELSRFMDQKLKNYSSGMQVRLAFSIAIRVKSDILLLDEVLAVGDEAFQQKSIDIFEKYKAQKQTIILVTHDMETVRRFCNKAILIQDGVLTMAGEPNKIASAYSRLNRKGVEADLEEENKAGQESDIKIEIKNKEGSSVPVFKVRDRMTVEVSWPKKFDNAKNVGLAIIKNSGEYIFGTNTFESPPFLKDNSIQYEVRLDLGPGKYYLMAGLFGKTKHQAIEYAEHGPKFIIETDPLDSELGLVRLDHSWKEE